MKRQFVIIVLIMLSSISFGQLNYRSKQSGNWNDVNTWEVNIAGVWQNATTVPDETSGVVTINILSGITVNTPTTANNVVISLISKLIINSPLSIKGVLKNNWVVENNAGIILVSTATTTGAIDGSGFGNITGNVTMQRYLSTGFGYKYFSSPFSTATVNEFGDDMDLNASFTLFYKYDENKTSSGWVGYKTKTNVLTPLQGYAVNFGTSTTPTTVDVTGVVNNGNISVPLYNHNNTYTKGFNLVGNPYPSSIDWYATQGWTKTNIDDALYFFKASTTDQYGGEYQTLINGVSSDGIVSRIIPSMQGFFVHVTDGAYPVEGALGMTNKVRVTNLSQEFTKGGETKGTSLLRFTAAFVDKQNNPDYAVLYFDSKATVEFNGQTDALKMWNSDPNVPSLYVKLTDQLNNSIKAINYDADTTYNIPLGIKTLRNGNIVFKLRDIEGDFANMTKIAIYDKEKNIEQDLLKGGEYQVNLKSGDCQNRFYLRFTNAQTSVTTAIETNVTDELFKVYSVNGMLKVNTDARGELRVYNINGQVLMNEKIEDAGYYEFNADLSEGIYIATLTSNGIQSSKKFYFRK